MGPLPRSVASPTIPLPPRTELVSQLESKGRGLEGGERVDALGREVVGAGGGGVVEELGAGEAAHEEDVPVAVHLLHLGLPAAARARASGAQRDANAIRPSGGPRKRKSERRGESDIQCHERQKDKLPLPPVSPATLPTLPLPLMRLSEIPGMKLSFPIK